MDVVARGCGKGLSQLGLYAGHAGFVPLRDGPDAEERPQPHRGTVRSAGCRWLIAGLTVVILEVAGVGGFLLEGVGLGLSLELQLGVFIYYLLLRHYRRVCPKEHWAGFFAVLQALALLYGLVGGLVSGHSFVQFLELNSRVNYTNVSPDIHPLSLPNAGSVSFASDAFINPALGGYATSVYDHEWHACVSPIVSPRSGKKVKFWAVTESFSGVCDLPRTKRGQAVEAIALPDSETEHARQAALAASVEFDFFLSENCMYLDWRSGTLSNAQLIDAKTTLSVSMLYPLVMVPVLAWTIFISIAFLRGNLRSFHWFLGSLA